MTLENDIKERIKRQKLNHPSRHVDNYSIKERQYSFGKRLYAVPKTDKIYIDVQDSRGYHTGYNDTEKSLLEKMTRELDLIESDNVRYDELTKLDQTYNFFVKQKGFYEIGFRMPKVMCCIGDRRFQFSKGCDISKISVAAGQKLGYNVKKVNLDTEFLLELQNVKLIVCYHVLEHITNPLKTIKRIHEQSDFQTYIHFEVPIEPGMPRLRYAHMHEFRYKDLTKMITEAGWTVLNVSSDTHSDGPFVERVFAVKLD